MDKDFKDIELSLHAILSCILFSGYMQGINNKNINTNVLYVASEEIKKLLK